MQTTETQVGHKVEKSLIGSILLEIIKKNGLVWLISCFIFTIILNNNTHNHKGIYFILPNFMKSAIMSKKIVHSK